MLNDSMSWMDLSVVLVGFFVEQAVAWVVSRSAWVMHMLSNLEPLVGERPIIAVGGLGLAA